MRSSAESRLVEIGLSLPKLAIPAGSYVPWVRSGTLLFVSGQIPKDAEGRLVTGQVPSDVTVEAARDAARLAGLGLLAAVRDALGSLDEVARVVKINAYVNAAPGFGDQPSVINSSIRTRVRRQESRDNRLGSSRTSKSFQQTRRKQRPTHRGI